MRLQVKRSWDAGTGKGGPLFMLTLALEGGAASSMKVQVPYSPAAQLVPDCEKDPSRLTEPVMLLVLDRLSHMGADGMAPLIRTDNDGTAYVFEVDDKDIPLADRLVAEKSCRYQKMMENRELFCTVVTSLASGEIHVRPTTRHRCGGCPVPDKRFACSNYQHIAVLQETNVTTKIIRALCEYARREKDQDPSACRPGGHACWVREVEFETPANEPQHELALHELFEFVDARWTVAFKNHLISSRRGLAFGKLATPCETGADLEAKLSALTQLMKGIEVPENLLKEEHRGQEEYRAGNSLARMRSALERTLAEDPATVAIVKKAVDVLRAANGLRNVAQHGGEMVARYAWFGLPYPPPPASETWARIQSRVAQALHDLATAIPD